jgi:hypothetical protein
MILLFVSSASCLVAVMAVIAVVSEQAKRESINNQKMQEILLDITLMHTDIIEYHAKLIKQAGHLEDNSSFSGSKLALIEARLDTIEKILLDVSPVLFPMTQTNFTKKVLDKTKDAGPFKGYTTLEDANKDAFNRMAKDDDRRRGMRFSPFDEENRRG